MFQQHYLMWLAGVIMLVVALLCWRDTDNPRRLTTGLFWALYGVIFMIGDWTVSLFRLLAGTDELATRYLHIGTGGLVVVMALLAGLGGVRSGRYAPRSEAQKQQSAQRLGNRLFLPALAIPLVTVAGVLAFTHLPGVQTVFFGAGNHATLVTLFSMMVGCVAGWLLALKMSGDTPLQSMQETRRLLEAIGWAFILPQLLATLGLLFTSAGVGSAISHLTEHYLAVDNRFIAVTVYAVGMALLTMIMGNAFAAFPIITAGVGIPILVLQHHGDPAVMAAIGMFSGYCGTLMTPMAANFNIVPAALLELPDRNAVIKAQIPTGVLLLIVNVLLLYFFMFR